MHDLDAIVEAVCEPNRPHKCLPSGYCYGRFHYCSRESQAVEPCIEEGILNNNASLRQLCEDLCQGKNMSGKIKDVSCNLKADCTHVLKCVTDPINQDSNNQVLVICVIVAAVVFGLALIARIGFLIWRRAKAHKKPVTSVEDQLSTFHNINGEPVVNIEFSRQSEDEINDSSNRIHRSTGYGGSETVDPAASQPFLTPNSAAIDTCNVQGRTETSRSSIVNDAAAVSISSSTRSSRSSDSSIASGRGGQETESQSSSPTINEESTAIHPSEIENRQQRAIHMPSVEPSNRNQNRVVTSLSSYNQTWEAAFE
uniref:Uncharacterized protein n=2 Tax=Arion vulgaris TaxID=1028688 RepID=A0A0B6ZZP4_9EUPU